MALNKWINDTVMYRLTLYSLLFISAAALLLSFFSLVSYSFIVLAASLTLAVAAAYALNALAASLWRAPANPESSLITASILFLIMPPAANLAEALDLLVVVAVAIFSKYLLVYQHRHLFNPAALAAFLAPFVTSIAAVWWVGSSALLPLTLIAGAFIVHKIRRYALVAAFAITAVIGMALKTVMLEGADQLVPALLELFTSWPLVFMGTVMLTEPITTPATRKLQIIYGVMVGLLFIASFELGPIFATPELALVLGNIYVFLVSRRRRMSLALRDVTKTSPETYHFTFSSAAPFSYAPGQYMEWTLPHQADNRGIRRYFTIAAAPGEVVSIGVKIRDKASSFKRALQQLKPGDVVTADGVYGDFRLHPDPKQPLVWIAGGIGVTPFRAMTKHLLARNEKRDIVLFYCCRDEDDFDYLDIFAEAERVGIRTVQVIDKKTKNEEWRGEVGFLTADMLRTYVPDVAGRHYYLSGPHVMVVSYQKLLRGLGVSSWRIHTDYFPGF